MKSIEISDTVDSSTHFYSFIYFSVNLSMERSFKSCDQHSLTRIVSEMDMLHIYIYLYNIHTNGMISE